MNTNPNAIKVLCYGDSNTWGQKPDKTGRYVADVRWTGRLQNMLGDGYYVVEEGLGSRTTNLDYDKKPGRNGKTYLQPCLHSHSPVDIVVIMLGTNDLKIEYSRNAQDIANALESLLDDVKTYAEDRAGDNPKVILVSPILIDSDAPRFAEFYTGYYDERAMKESRNLAVAISELADRHECTFVDAAEVSHPGDDGIHFSEDSQEPLATVLYKKISELNA